VTGGALGEGRRRESPGDSPDPDDRCRVYFRRLAVRDFARDPELEHAFLDGYGTDPRDPEAWKRTRIREAVATASWAYQVGDEAFEQEGLRGLAIALE
jgi:hypothetical protein